MFEASEYQKGIVEFVQSGSGNAIVGAVAGSGKTTTLVKCIAPEIHGKGVFLAFNKSIASELGSRLPEHFEARTIHSLAFGAVKSKHKRSKVNAKKYRNLVYDYLDDMPYASQNVLWHKEQDECDLFNPLVKLIDLSRSTLTDPKDASALRNLALHYEMDLPDDEECESYIYESVSRILNVGRSMMSSELDFTDMLWICATEENIRPKKYDWILVDECQDLSKAQLAVVKKAGRKGSRYIFVGDEYQAINGFAGADCDSFNNIKESMKCKVLPLSICYRCPSSHLDLAREIVPHIEAHERAKDGIIEELKASDIVEHLQEGDLLLSRVNAPLVSLCFSLILAGKPARVKGRAIGDNLVATAKKISKRRDFLGWDNFGESVSQWAQRESTKILKKNGNDHEDIKLQNLSDKAECLRIIWARCEANSLRDFKTCVDDIFSDDKPGIQLSSVHRAKGLEADRVFILNPNLLPGPWATPGTWQHQQELNIKYVALTRAKEYLAFVH